MEKLQAALADDSAGQEASDRLSEEISQLKARVASERMRFSHITEALEAAKGSIEEVWRTPHEFNTLIVWRTCRW